MLDSAENAKIVQNQKQHWLFNSIRLQSQFARTFLTAHVKNYTRKMLLFCNTTHISPYFPSFYYPSAFCTHNANMVLTICIFQCYYVPMLFSWLRHFGVTVGQRLQNS